MGKISKIVVCGYTGVGKTAAIEQLIFGNHIIGTVRCKFLAHAITWFTPTSMNMLVIFMCFI
jgi:hypothetical protein